MLYSLFLINEKRKTGQMESVVFFLYDNMKGWFCFNA